MSASSSTSTSPLNDPEGQSFLSVRRLIALAALIAITVVAWDPWLLVVVSGGRERRVAALEGAADGRDPAFIELVREADARIGADELVALIVSPEAGDSRWYLYRTEWILAGRDIRPMFPPENVERAQVLILWKAAPNPNIFETILEHPDGSVARRR